MKKRFHSKNLIGKRNLFLTVVALILVMLTVVGVSYSWIEQISNIEMVAGEDNMSPLRIDLNRLNKEAEGEIYTTSPTTETTIDLSRYFNKSGDMHLSSCYGDGNVFYFPKDSSVEEGADTAYRRGTKDDANVNYISITFPLKNKDTKYEQAFWFDQNTATSFFNSGDSDLNSLIRCSFTVDSKTTIYSASSSSSATATYKTIKNYGNYAAVGENKEGVLTNECSSFAGFTYLDAHNDPRETGSPNANKRAVDGSAYDLFSDNKLFVLSPGQKATITIKIWLEYDGANRLVDTGSINLKLVSSFSKQRKIYFIDSSLHNTEAMPSTPWVTNGHSLTLLILEPSGDNYKVLSRLSPVQDKNKYKFTVPLHYKGLPAVFVMSGTSCDVSCDGKAVFAENATTREQAEHYWPTSLPRNYEDSYFTEFTDDYGTWSDTVYCYYFVDYLDWCNDAHNYMWNSKIIDGTTKVVSNADTYPGKNMYQATGLTVGTTITNGQITIGSSYHRVNGIFFDEKYSHVVFSGGNYNVDKTADLKISDSVFVTLQSTYGLYITSSNVYFDLIAKKWVTDVGDICTIDTGYYNYVENDGGGPVYYRSVNNSNISYGTRTLDKNHNKHWFCVSNGTEYWKFKNNGSASNYDYHSGQTGTAIPLTTSGYSERIKVHNGSYDNVPETGLYTFKFDKTDSSEPKVTVYFPNTDPNETSSGSSGSSSGAGTMSGYSSLVSNSYVEVNPNDRAQIYTNGTNSYKARLEFTSTEEKYYVISIENYTFGENGNGPHQPDANFTGFSVSKNNGTFRLTVPSAGNYIICFHFEDSNHNNIIVDSFATESNS